MDTSSSVSRSPLTEAANTVPSFEDELVLSNGGEETTGSDAGASGASLVVTGRGRAQDNQTQKKGQQTNKLSEERKRYHIDTVK